MQPQANNGKLFQRVVELTGITQEQVDSGMSIDKALSRLVDCCSEVDKVYTWGTYDSFLLRKNSKYCKSRKGQIYNLSTNIIDLGELITKELGLKNSISLVNTSHLLGLTLSNHHSAEDDCELLRVIYLSRGKYNKELLQEYIGLDKVRTHSQKIVFEDSHFKFTDSDYIKTKINVS